MKWYNKWYIQYPIAWILTILILVYILPPASKYQLGSHVGMGLFIATLCIAAFREGIKRKKK